MSWIKTNGPYTILSLLALWILIFTIYDIVFGKEWIIYLLASYIVLIVLIVILAIFKTRKKTKIAYNYTFEEFEKTLKGGLFHYKCPNCLGIFAIKKSRSNDDKPVKMTCPDCGVTGVIPANPRCIEEEIPEKKSVKANFRCSQCGEGVTIWAEGKDLNKNVKVLTCPFCGDKKPLHRF